MVDKPRALDMICAGALLTVSLTGLFAVTLGDTVPTILAITGSTTCGQETILCGNAELPCFGVPGSCPVSFSAHSSGMMPGGTFSGNLAGTIVSGVFSITNTNPGVPGLPCNTQNDIGLAGMVTSGDFLGDQVVVFGCADRPGMAAPGVPVGIIIQDPTTFARFVFNKGTGKVVSR